MMIVLDIRWDKKNLERRAVIGIVKLLATVWKIEASTAWSVREARIRLAAEITCKCQYLNIACPLKSKDRKPAAETDRVILAVTTACAHLAVSGASNLASSALFRTTREIAQAV